MLILLLFVSENKKTPRLSNKQINNEKYERINNGVHFGYNAILLKLI